MKKKAATKKPKKERVVKTRNAGTLTESGFWSFIRSCLRQKSRWWKPITNAKIAARRAYKGPNKIQKWEYQCNQCKNWFKDKETVVDHLIECGELKGPKDLEGFIERLFCEQEGFQILCKPCHHIKTQEYMKNKKIN